MNTPQQTQAKVLYEYKKNTDLLILAYKKGIAGVNKKDLPALLFALRSSINTYQNFLGLPQTNFEKVKRKLDARPYSLQLIIELKSHFNGIKLDEQNAKTEDALRGDKNGLTPIPYKR